MSRQDDLNVARFAVITAFLNQCQKENDNYVYCYSKTKMEIDYKAVELAVINNIEGAFTQEYGQRNGEKKAIKMYTYMIDDISKCGADTESYKLSKIGLEMMNELFHSMVDMFEADMAHKANTTLQ